MAALVGLVLALAVAAYAAAMAWLLRRDAAGRARSATSTVALS